MRFMVRADPSIHLLPASSVDLFDANSPIAEGSCCGAAPFGIWLGESATGGDTPCCDADRSGDVGKELAKDLAMYSLYHSFLNVSLCLGIIEY